MARRDLVDATEHTGSLFWLVLRTSEQAQANMVLESISWEHKVTMSLPLKKRKHSVEWESRDLPTVPLLFNKKAIKAHQRLAVFQPPAKKEEKQEEKKNTKKEDK